MKTPYEILEVEEGADDAQIKKAYLAMVRRFPPERSPDDFRRIHQAFALIKTEEDRLNHRLFHCRLPTPVEIAAVVLPTNEARKRVGEKEFKERLAGDLRDYCAGLKL